MDKDFFQLEQTRMNNQYNQNIKTIEACTSVVSGVFGLFVKDQENARQIYNKELEVLDAREFGKSEIKREKIKLKKAKIKKQIKEIEAENLRYELQIKKEAFEKAVAAEERVQKKRIDAEKEIAIVKIQYYTGVAQIIREFYLPIISMLRNEYKELEEQIYDTELDQNERFKLQHIRDNVDTRLMETEKNFNQSIKQLNDAVNEISIQKRIDTGKLYLGM